MLKTGKDGSNVLRYFLLPVACLEVQAATLLHVAGREALEIYNTFSWESPDDRDKVDEKIEKFDHYCNPDKNMTWERHKFLTRNQKPGETIDQYTADLKQKP